MRLFLSISFQSDSLNPSMASNVVLRKYVSLKLRWCIRDALMVIFVVLMLGEVPAVAQTALPTLFVTTLRLLPVVIDHRFDSRYPIAIWALIPSLFEPCELEAGVHDYCRVVVGDSSASWQ